MTGINVIGQNGPVNITSLVNDNLPKHYRQYSALVKITNCVMA